MKRPELNEYAEYYHTYVRQIPEGDIISTLQEQIESTRQFLENIPEAKGDYRYAPGKWSVKDVVGHVLDIERVFAFRALMFARNDPGPFPSVEQDDIVRAANFGARTLQDLTQELWHLRWANIVLFRSFDDEISLRRGVASNFEFTVRAIAYVIAGHERHHMKVLGERYL